MRLKRVLEFHTIFVQIILVAYKREIHVRWIPYRHAMARPQILEGKTACGYDGQQQIY
jgi:hypothetical protein